MPTTTTTQNSNQTTTPTPYGFGGSIDSASLLNQILSGALGGYNTLSTDPSAIYAGPTAGQVSANNWFGGLSPQIQGGVGTLLQQAQDTASGKYLGSNNADLAKAVWAGLAPVQDNLMNSILPGIADQAQQVGAFGGSRQGVLQGQAIKDFDTTAANAMTQAQQGNYQFERNNQLNAGNLFSTAMGVGANDPAGIAGTQQQGWNQAQLNANNSAPFNGISQLQSAFGTSVPFAQTNTQGSLTQTQNTPNTNGLLKGLLGAASLAANLIPGIGSAVGAGLGTIASGMGGGAQSSPTMGQIANSGLPANASSLIGLI